MNDGTNVSPIYLSIFNCDPRDVSITVQIMAIFLTTYVFVTVGGRSRDVNKLNRVHVDRIIYAQYLTRLDISSTTSLK